MSNDDTVEIKKNKGLAYLTKEVKIKRETDESGFRFLTLTIHIEPSSKKRSAADLGKWLERVGWVVLPCTKNHVKVQLDEVNGDHYAGDAKKCWKLLSDLNAVNKDSGEEQKAMDIVKRLTTVELSDVTVALFAQKQSINQDQEKSEAKGIDNSSNFS